MTTTRESSETALTAAAARAAHLIVDGAPTIFSDPLAEVLLGDRAGELIGYHRAHGGHPVLAGARAQVTCRSRYTEDRLAGAVDAGVRQYAVLGAGLDTFAYRSGLADRLHVFEVDHAASQRWKRDRLAAAGIAARGRVTHVAVDLETDALVARLLAAGFDPAGPAVVSWLGVTMYLTRDAIARTLAELGRLAAGTELIVDYMVPDHLRDPDGRIYVELVAPVAAQRGEPWRTFFTPADLSGLLDAYGLATVEHARQHEMVDPALWERTDALRPSTLTRIVRARVAPG